MSYMEKKCPGKILESKEKGKVKTDYMTKNIELLSSRNCLFHLSFFI